MYIYIYIYIDLHLAVATLPPDVSRFLNPLWHIQDILSLVFVCSRINHPFITPAHLQYPHYCNTIARLLCNI